MKIAILDRDGTLNPSGESFIASPDEWTPLPGALEAVARLNHAGWHVVVATNQPGLGRGLFDVMALNAIHAKLHRKLAAVGGRIDAVFYCPHAPDDLCACRKPAPGLMEQIRDRYGVEGDEVLVAGNCVEHLRAGAAIGAQLHRVGAAQAAEAPLVASGDALLPSPWPEGTQFHASLADFADHVAAQSAVAAPGLNIAV
ncbi:D-glycero-beta-D-manno-heptose 1,7-bisphosphate 7-phosphatase [Acidovorax sp. SUPP2522]|uniref:D-glycero-beta-D-manno-heptose 1,7-bisphosphate 7-phosphatase n=1 Tax=unclassified Acidovorax TaxID=2684926 RepID=UPI00234A88E6|nr:MULTISPECIES: D-glycero-beta-D-manno-heptose 1,7-bisphosphate 7-phosphatase [unclassified Acidovorax]WCM96982.1 D-glycero-beta-D-manno-heptose 1,7-bisphosphate 7-phosphatase [Acidovorax sp. GBBC 1281]GKT15194.1 D-glycero-beta-D-manno-heptose 1,7-bisphosphate 7-phosphatase [Acidovorax sp. SUPP2522]